MNKKMLRIGLFCLVLGLCCAVPKQGRAAYDLLDGDLRVKGSLYEFLIVRTKIPHDERQYRDTRLGLLRTKGTLELLYKAVDEGELSINLFAFLQYWHEAVPDIDDEYHDSIAHWNRKRYQGPFFDQDDWINEMYVDIYWDRWNVRLGKQIVFWSEVEMVRTIDRINPLDLRYTTPGIDPWDEMKLGLWMMRGFYNSDLPGQLVFEWIWIPGDFEQVRTPAEGTNMGAYPAPQGPEDQRPRPYGQSAAINKMFHKSRPAFTLRNSQWALRVRGNSEVPLFGETYLLDWTVSWYHGMNQTPVARNRTIGRPSSSNFNPETLNGYLNRVAFPSRVLGRPLPPFPDDRYWTYKFFDAIGAGCQTYVPALKGVLRGEVSYEIGLPENSTFPDHINDAPSYMKPITGTTERDAVNVGITLDRPIKWTWLSQRWGSSGVFDVTFGWFGQRRSGNVSRVRRTFRYNDRTQSNFTLLLRTRLNHSELWPVIRFLYNTRNWGYGAFSLRYTPDTNMRYETGFMWFFARDPYDSPEANAENKDFIYFRVGYEF